MIPHAIIRELRTTREWKAVQVHIEEVITSLDSLADIDTADDRAVAIEVAARQRAQEKLKEILQPFRDYQERSDTSALAEDRRTDAGL